MKYVIDGKRTQVYTTHQGQRGSDGKDGSSIESVEFVGQSEIGNTYRMIFSDGHSYDFTAPRGTKGKDGKDGKDGISIKGDKGEAGKDGSKIERVYYSGKADDGSYKYTMQFSDGDYEFISPKGNDGLNGNDGRDGEDGKNAVGYFQMYVDGSGNLILQHYEGDEAPEFRYDASTGILYMIG